MLKAACIASLALAAAPAAAAPPDLAAWVAANTDIPPAQVAITGPTHVYGVEPLGARTPAGEVIALVRTEPLADDWGAQRGFQSWDAHILFDCAGGRLRQIRGATYPERNRKGLPKPEPVPEGWTTPQPAEPAARLLAAACDPTFDWALRGVGLRLATLRMTPPPAATPSVTAALAARVAAPVIAQQGAFAVQVARGDSEEGARRALTAARKALGPAAEGLIDATETTRFGVSLRYTVRLAGFSDRAAAQAACNTLIKARQDCFLWQEGVDIPAATPPAAPLGGFVVQLARGPSEEGARRAVDAARRLLQPSAPRRLTATTTASPSGDTPLYTALLGGFQTAGEAARACAALTRAGHACFARPADTETAANGTQDTAG